MKQHVLFWIVLSLSQGLLNAQTIITNAVFPSLGDTLTYGVANTPENLQITAAGESQLWNYSSLEADFFVRQTYETPDSGLGVALFPQASLLSRAAQGLESYWRVTENQVELLGAFGQDPLGLGIVFSTPFTPALTEISTPLNYLDTLESNSSFVFAFATEDLPDTIVALLPIAPDSFRVRTNINRLDVVDAWGNLQLPEDSYEVLRQKRLETAVIRVDAKISFLGWQDVTDVISPLLMGPDFQQDSLLTYRFWSNEAKDPVLICNVDSTGQNITTAQFRNSLLTTHVSEETTSLAHLSVFPNPADDIIQINIQGVPVGQYHIQFFYNNGVLAKEERLWISGNDMTRSLSISDLQPGFFIGILKNIDTGKTMGRPVLLIKR
jgi:hypothetical protein